MGKHSAGRRRAPLAVATSAAAVLATGAFATTLVDGSLEVPRVTAAPDTTPTTTEPVVTRTPDRGDDLNRASRSFTRTAPPSTAPPSTAPAADSGSPSATPSDADSASATPTAARSQRPSASPSASPTPSASATPTVTPTAPATPTATASPTPTGSVLDVVPGIIGGLLP